MWLQNLFVVVAEFFGDLFVMVAEFFGDLPWRVKDNTLKNHRAGRADYSGLVR